MRIYDQKAANFVKSVWDNLKVGENIVNIPAGLGQVVNADRTITSASKAVIVKNAEGAMNQLKTAYPVVK